MLNYIVYRCSRQDEMYLYLRADVEQDTLPEALLKKMGQLTEVMPLSLSANSKLARANPEKVMAALSENGYYLQLPPPKHIDPKLYWGD